MSDRKHLDSLHDAIKKLPALEAGDSTLVELLLRLIMDTPNDDPESPYASRATVKLKAIELIHSINKDSAGGAARQALLDLLDEANEAEVTLLHAVSSDD